MNQQLVFAQANPNAAFWWLSGFLGKTRPDLKLKLIDVYKNGFIDDFYILNDIDFDLSNKENGIYNFILMLNNILSKEEQSLIYNAFYRLAKHNKTDDNIANILIPYIRHLKVLKNKTKVTEVDGEICNIEFENVGFDYFDNKEYRLFIYNKCKELLKVNIHTCFYPGNAKFIENPWVWLDGFDDTKLITNRRSASESSIKHYIDNADDYRVMMFLGVVKSNIRNNDKSNYHVIPQNTEELLKINNSLNRMMKISFEDLRSDSTEFSQLFSITHKHDFGTKSNSAGQKIIIYVRKLIYGYTLAETSITDYLRELAIQDVKKYLKLIKVNLEENDKMERLWSDEFLTSGVLDPILNLDIDNINCVEGNYLVLLAISAIAKTHKRATLKYLQVNLMK